MGFSVQAPAASTTAPTPARTQEPEDESTMKPPAIQASPSWPCANCQTTVSTERCPTCQGVQVRILDQQSSDKNNNQNNLGGITTSANHWLERLSPAIFAARYTPTPQDTDAYSFRPLDPVACVLASAPSPIVDEKKVVALRDIEDRVRLRKRPLVTDLPGPKKSKWLSAV